MTVTDCTLARENRGLTITNADHRYTRRYIVNTNDSTDAELTIFNGAVASTPHPLPNKLDPFSDPGGDIDLSALARDYVFRQNRDKLTRWQVDVTWRPGQPGEPTTPEEIDPNPLQRPVVLWLEQQSTLEEITHDVDGNPFHNTAGQAFPERDYLPRTSQILVARKNYATLDEIWTLNATYEKTTNDVAFFGQPAKTWRYMSTRTGEPKVENGIQYYEGVTRIAHKGQQEHPDDGLIGGWEIMKVSKGWQVRPVGPGVQDLITPTNKDGVPVGEPVLLNVFGNHIIGAEDPVTLRFNVLDAVDYANIGIGS